MSSQNNTDSSSHPPEDKGQRQILKEGGYDNFQHFMLSHDSRMHNDEDVQHGKEILSRYEEFDRAYANHKSSENDKICETNGAYDSDSDQDSSSGVRIGYCEVVESDEDDSDGENGCPVEGAYSHYEWGVDDPQFEGYPAFSDDEEGHNSDQGDYDDEADYDDGDCDEEGW
ncbi:hypothetical protein BDW62DRAFT_203961 [Aspergillus aurantiobrunneus]